MSNPARKAYYAEARRLTRLPSRHFLRQHFGDRFTVTLPNGLSLAGTRYSVTFRLRPRRARRELPILWTAGPVTETWAVN